MRIERIGLEHHGDVSVSGAQCRHVASADVEFTGVGGLKSRDDAQ